MPEATDERSVFEVAERGGFIVPGPLVSRGRPLFDASGPLPPAPHGVLGWSAQAAADGANVGAGTEPWLALHAGVGPARLLVSWAAPGAVAAAGPGRPTRYRIETSANSRRGGDGEWRRELSVAENTAVARAHTIEFDGQSWVRLTFEEVLAGVALDRFELHDASDGADDAWLILGDEFASWGLGQRTGEPSVADLVSERYPGYHPAFIDEACLGETPVRTLARLDEIGTLHPEARRVGLGYAGASLSGADAETALEALVVALLERGYAPVIARAPLGGGPGVERALAFNRAIAELEARHRLVRGPDIQGGSGAWPAADSLEGRRVLQRLWLEALDVLYVPQ